MEDKKVTFASHARKCPSCGLPITDPLRLLCPRCHATLTACTGCENCGACKKR